ncbi:MAG: hypothetical protein F4X81_08630 [Gammaproteobacteria bacterium]|nr:hypothetical protein [Gammaproteobacteria bacterium]
MCACPPPRAVFDTAAGVGARYSQGREAAAVTVAAEDPNGERRELTVPPLAPAELPSAWHV